MRGHSRLEEAGFEVLNYEKQWSHNRISLDPKDVELHTELLAELLKEAYEIREAR